MSSETTAITPYFRAAFVHIFKAASSFENQEPKFSTVMLFPPDADLGPMKAAALAAAKDRWPNELPQGMKNPFRNAAEKSHLAGYEEGWTFVTATSMNKPGAVDQSRKPLVEAEGKLYAGVWCRADVNAFAYDKAGNKGVSFGLNNIQLVRDGEPFVGRRAEAAFDEIPMEDIGDDELFGEQATGTGDADPFS